MFKIQIIFIAKFIKCIFEYNLIVLLWQKYIRVLFFSFKYLWHCSNSTQYTFNEFIIFRKKTNSKRNILDYFILFRKNINFGLFQPNNTNLAHFSNSTKYAFNKSIGLIFINTIKHQSIDDSCNKIKKPMKPTIFLNIPGLLLLLLNFARLSFLRSFFPYSSLSSPSAILFIYIFLKSDHYSTIIIILFHYTSATERAATSSGPRAYLNKRWWGPQVVHRLISSPHFFNQSSILYYFFQTVIWFKIVYQI